LARPAVLKGEVDAAVAAGATTFTAYGTDVFDGLVLAGGTEAEPTTDNHWIIEFTRGAYTGLVKQVTAFSGSMVTVAGGLPVIDKGTRFVLRKALEARDRKACGPVAPPDGLYLTRVDYAARSTSST
jgi:hypothetical protein